MSVFDKIKNSLFEEEENNEGSQNSLSEFEKYLPKDVENLSNNSIDDLPDSNIDTSQLISIEDIYSNNIESNDCSIFKVDEIRNALSKSMTNAVKKESTLGMLSVNKIQIEDVMNDAKNRINILNNSLNKFSNETKNISLDASSQIEEKQKEIEELKKIIEDRNKLQEQQEKIIIDEINKINEIVDFIK